MTEAGTRVEGKEEFPMWKLEVRVGQEALHKAICDLGKQRGRGVIAQRSHQIDTVCCFLVLTSSSALCRETSAR